MALNTNTTLNTAESAAFNKDYYDRKLLTTAKTKLCYALHGQKRPIPRNQGKRVEFRRYDLFTPDTESLSLVEGVTPDGQSLSQTTVEALVKQYGAYVTISDLLDMTAIDPVQRDAATLLGDQLGRTIEFVTRNAMIEDASTQYANGHVSRVDVTAADVLTVNDVRKAVLALEEAKAPKFSEGGRGEHYICIVDPATAYDLMNDAAWLDVAKYQNKEAIYKGELGELFGVVFIKSTEGLVTKQSVLNKVNATVTSGTAFVLKNTPTAAEVAYLSTPGNKVKVGSTELTISATTPYDAATKTVNTTTTFTAEAGLAANAIVYSEDAGAPAETTYKGADIHHSLIFGQDAYGIIDIAGSGAMRTIIKPQGSGGTEDPLDQRATVAAKVDAYTVKVLNSLWIIDIEHATTY